MGSNKFHCHYKSSQTHDAVIKWKHFPRYWPFVWGIHRSPVNSPHKGQWRGILMYAWINGWINNREARDLRREFSFPGTHFTDTFFITIQLRWKFRCTTNKESLQSQVVVKLYSTSQFIYSADQCHASAIEVPLDFVRSHRPSWIMSPEHQKCSNSLMTIEHWQIQVFVVMSVATDGLVPLGARCKCNHNQIQDPYLQL